MAINRFYSSSAVILKWLLLSVAFIAISCKQKQEQTKPTVENISESVYASGIVKSNNQYQVFATVNGLVEQIMITEGDTVRKGSAIMVIRNETSKLNADNARLSAEYADVGANEEKLNELRLTIQLARSKMMNDSLLLSRQQNLWNEGIGTKNELEQRELALKNSTTAYRSAILRLEEMQKQLSYAAQQSRKNLQISTTIAKDYTIKSEVNGRVYSILKEKGEMVNQQSPVAIIGDANSFMLELQIDEYDIAKISTGQKIMLKLDSYKGQVFEAVVKKINPIMNERSRSFTIDAGFVKQPPVLYPNLTVEANIIIQTKEKALTVPRSYLVDEGFLMLANNEKRAVIIGLKDYQKVEILKGITATDIIYKSGK